MGTGPSKPLAGQVKRWKRAKPSTEPDVQATFKDPATPYRAQLESLAESTSDGTSSWAGESGLDPTSVATTKSGNQLLKSETPEPSRFEPVSCSGESPIIMCYGIEPMTPQQQLANLRRLRQHSGSPAGYLFPLEQDQASGGNELELEPQPIRSQPNLDSQKAKSSNRSWTSLQDNIRSPSCNVATLSIRSSAQDPLKSVPVAILEDNIQQTTKIHVPRRKDLFISDDGSTPPIRVNARSPSQHTAADQSDNLVPTGERESVPLDHLKKQSMDLRNLDANLARNEDQAYDNTDKRLSREEQRSTSLDGAEDPSECGITEVPDNNYGSLSGAVERTRSLPSNDSRSSRIKRAVQAVHEQSRLRSRQKAQEHSPQIKATYRDPSSNPIDQDSQIEGDRLASLDNDTQNTVSVNNLSTKQKRLKGIDKYDDLGVYGEGRTGIIKLMRNKLTLELVAAKWIDYSSECFLSKETEREICNHRRLKHPGIIGLREVISTDSAIVICMEHASGGQVDTWIESNGRFTESRAHYIFSQMVNAVAFCHRRGVVHRNLRADNMLITGNAYHPLIKISGFGYSKDIALDSEARSLVSLPAYQPPETLTATRNELAAADSAQLGMKTDCWALGVILFYLLAGRLPFWEGETPGLLSRKVLRNIASASFSFPPDVSLSAECLDFISRVLCVSPSERLSAEEMLNHPWLAGKVVPLHVDTEESQQTLSEIQNALERSRQRNLQRRQQSP